MHAAWQLLGMNEFIKVVDLSSTLDLKVVIYMIQVRARASMMRVVMRNNGLITRLSGTRVARVSATGVSRGAAALVARPWHSIGISRLRGSQLQAGELAAGLMRGYTQYHARAWPWEPA